jgi:magnesium transporter
MTPVVELLAPLGPPNSREADGLKWPKEMRQQLKSMQRDVQSLSDHVSYLGNKVTFLLDAMVGVISVEQNNIIKLFSVAAVVLMPPTLIASIYGMNFRHIPELEWVAGYPYAIGLMVCSAILPFVIFKWKKWL